jgi:RHS repeat-associated protein
MILNIWEMPMTDNTLVRALSASGLKASIHACNKEISPLVFDILLITWVFEEGTFVPAAKITEKEQLSIVTNYLGTPEAMYREDGETVWTCELNSYGKVRDFKGLSKTECPFGYQGQYQDEETGLYYNRFRYYSPEEGMYLSKDPIGLAGNNPTLYGYVKDVNSWVDVFGLDCKIIKAKSRKDAIKESSRACSSSYSFQRRSKYRYE